ncbi:MAG: phospho-sugar mutase, partial [Evtepia sp.]
TGLANYLLKNQEDACHRGVAIAYDSRNHSREFADAAAATFRAKGFKVCIFSRITPTPVLSYAVAALHCCAGIVITASHNPKEYNGYKVYDETGCQVTDRAANGIYAEIQKIDLYQDLHLLSQKSKGLLQELDESVLQSFVRAVMTQSVLKDSLAKADLKVRYTPLHGTGRVPVTMALREAGFSSVSIVEEQANEDGDFSTVKTPNPEDREALSIGIAQAGSYGDDLVLGTDPDCDRVGVAVLHHGAYQLLTGNQVGALLIAF